MRRLLLSLVAGAAVFAAEPIRLVPTPQKFRTFYRLDDPAVPEAQSIASTVPQQITSTVRLVINPPPSCPKGH